MDPRSAVQDTNDCSTVSKFSTSSAGYFVDGYVESFVSRAVRRAPLIHRGYYVRWKAIDHVRRTFLQQTSNDVSQKPLQLIYLGSGFDTTVFQMHSEEFLCDYRIFEVDFPSVIQRKLGVISESLHLQKCTGQLKWVNDCVVLSEKYCAICCDISNLPTLQCNLQKAGIDFGSPTLFISECVLTYINATSVNALLAWSAASFSNAMFCCYEQIQPQDAFGRIMQNHFKQLHSPLQSINIYPTQESQKRRYLSAGWDECNSCDMNTFFSALPKHERRRIEKLELFDEHEEWHLTCSHYFLLCAYKGQARQLSNQLLLNSTTCYGSLHPIYGSCEVCKDDRKFSSCFLKRYGHGSCCFADGSILIMGGYGVSSVEGIVPHSRLEDVLKLQPDQSQGWTLSTLDTVGTHPGKLMHHTVTAIAGGTAALVVGGRGSPAQPSQSLFLLKMDVSLSSKAMWSKVVLHPDSSLMEPRWRHTASCINITDGECVLIVGGSSTRSRALADIYMLNITTWKLRKLCVSLPEGRCSHCSAVYQGGLIIAGGLSPTLQPISSCLYLTHALSGDWNLSKFQVSPPLPPKYSMSVTVVGKQLILLGGVGLQTSPDIIILDLTLGYWFGLKLSGVGQDILLHKHTCHFIPDRTLLFLGGGGNCFSFGTHFNSGIHAIDIASIDVRWK